MGLDMYLTGEKFFWTNWNEPEKNRKEDGLKVEKVIVKLGYWRKHPNLHGFIVQKYADSRDECQNIELSVENLKEIIAATMNKTLPDTEGFFFGKSLSEDDEPTIKILMEAIKWAETKEDGVSRSVHYQAS